MEQLNEELLKQNLMLRNQIKSYLAKYEDGSNISLMLKETLANLEAQIFDLINKKIDTTEH